MDPNPTECFESWARELKSRSDRVRNLIGDAHWLSDGHHKEEILREFLRRHLPSRLNVTRGFIRSSTPNTAVSHEIDAMVTDSESELPWFAEGDLIIAPPSSVVAQIHVKTEFGSQELTDVLRSGSHNRRIFEESISDRSLWFGGVFFSNTNATGAERQKSTWAAAIKKARDDGLSREDLPDCIIIVGGPAFLPEKDPACAQKGFVIRAYDCGQAAAAVFLSHLYDSISLRGKDSTRRGEWFRMITQVSKGPLFTEEL